MPAHPFRAANPRETEWRMLAGVPGDLSRKTQFGRGMTRSSDRISVTEPLLVGFCAQHELRRDVVFKPVVLDDADYPADLVAVSGLQHV